jgi:hypothetical protein
MARSKFCSPKEPAKPVRRQDRQATQIASPPPNRLAMEITAGQRTMPTRPSSTPGRGKMALSKVMGQPSKSRTRPGRHPRQTSAHRMGMPPTTPGRGKMALSKVMGQPSKSRTSPRRHPRRTSAQSAPLAGSSRARSSRSFASPLSLNCFFHVVPSTFRRCRGP